MENELMNEVTNLQARSSQIKAPHYESTPCLSWNLALVFMETHYFHPFNSHRDPGFDETQPQV